MPLAQGKNKSRDESVDAEAMAEVVVIALGLPGLFTTCIESFELIQYAKTFEDDRRDLVLRLEILEARLA